MPRLRRSRARCGIWSHEAARRVRGHGDKRRHPARAHGRGVDSAVLRRVHVAGLALDEGDPEMTKSTNPTAAEFAAMLAEVKVA
jgi:hypothetical protein